jgi:hypothetical protein
MHGRAQKGCCLIAMHFIQPCILSGTLSLRKRASRTVKSFFVIYGFKCGFPGLLVPAEPRKMRAVAQKIRRLVRRIFCCALADRFWAHPLLKSTCTDFGGVGWCRRSWRGQTVTGEPTALHNHLLRCLPTLHAAVWPKNPAHKLTRSAAARLLRNHRYKTVAAVHFLTYQTHVVTTKHTRRMCVCV